MNSKTMTPSTFRYSHVPSRTVTDRPFSTGTSERLQTSGALPFQVYSGTTEATAGLLPSPLSFSHDLYGSCKLHSLTDHCPHVD